MGGARNKPHEMTCTGSKEAPQFTGLIHAHLCTLRSSWHQQSSLGISGRWNSLFLLLKDEKHSLWNLPGGRKSNLHLEGKEDSWIGSPICWHPLLLLRTRNSHGMRLAGTPRQPQKKRWGIRGENALPSVHHTVRAPGWLVCILSQEVQPHEGRGARWGQNCDCWSGPYRSLNHLPSPSAVLALQTARGYSARRPEQGRGPSVDAPRPELVHKEGWTL